MIIKDLNVNDEKIKQVAALYINSWRKNYADILPKSYLDDMNVKDISNRFNSYISKANQGMIIALNDDEVLGFSAYMPCDRIDNSLLLEMLHVKPAAQSTSIGKALIIETWKKANKLGFEKMSISYMKDNKRAGEIYIHLGAEFIYDYYEDFGGRDVQSELLLWTKETFKL